MTARRFGGVVMALVGVPLAQLMAGDKGVQSAAQLVVWTTLLSAAVIFGAVVALRTLGLV